MISHFCQFPLPTAVLQKSALKQYRKLYRRMQGEKKIGESNIFLSLSVASAGSPDSVSDPIYPFCKWKDVPSVHRRATLNPTQNTQPAASCIL